MLQDLLNSCPLIVSLILKRCTGLDESEAPTLEHLSFSNYSYLDLDVIECQNLKFLELNEVKTSNGFLDLVSKSQSLEVLKIQNCNGIRDIDISNLEVLKIVNCSGIRVIDSSNLVSLEYIGDQIPNLKGQVNQAN
ncbi:hypothetical protein P3S68_032055 [Capsicum galapagoense]